MKDGYFKTCSFCGKGENHVGSMFSAGDVNICDECICYCYEMLYGPSGKTAAKTKSSKSGSKGSKASDLGINLLPPAEIKKVLDEYGKGYLSGIIDISTTMYSSHALKEDGTIWSWGSNSDGQLGVNASTDSSTHGIPRKTIIDNVAKISSGAYSILALKEDGTVWSWGWNAYGQLGLGTTSVELAPKQCKFDSTTYVTNIVDIGTSGGTHFILDSNNKVFACGGNAQGEVGDNTTTNKSYYVEVKSKYGEALTNNIVKLSSSMARTNN